MESRQIATTPDPYAPFHISQAIRAGDFIFVSGQAALSDTGEIVGVGDFDAQAEATFSNLRKILEAAGSTLKQVVKVTIFLTDMSHFPKMIDLRARHFTKPYPADTIVEVRQLALPELMIEIEAVALTSGEILPART
ncbi:MAG: RidA family protein [Pseudomonadota bacterium]